MPRLHTFVAVLQSPKNLSDDHLGGTDDWNALCRLKTALASLFVHLTSPMRIKSIALALLLAGGAACNTFMHGSGTGDQNQQTYLQVDNQGFQDMDVFAARFGQRARLGLATALHKTNFTIPSALISGLTPLRFVADPIGGSRASVSQEITVAPGDTVVMTIPPT